MQKFSELLEKYLEALEVYKNLEDDNTEAYKRKLKKEYFEAKENLDSFFEGKR